MTIPAPSITWRIRKAKSPGRYYGKWMGTLHHNEDGKHFTVIAVTPKDYFIEFVPYLPAGRRLLPRLEGMSNVTKLPNDGSIKSMQQAKKMAEKLFHMSAFTDTVATEEGVTQS